MYLKIIDEINRFLNLINVPGTPINPDAFQGVFIKKLSNQNIIKDKRRINAGKTDSTVGQTHIDITGRHGKLFFFEELNNATTSIQSMDVDLYCNNLKYLKDINHASNKTDSKGNTYFIRKTTNLPKSLADSDLALHSSAYKKFGHNGDQVQINIPDSEETFTQLQKCAFQDDALVMLRYDYLRYLAVLIPFELCVRLYSITNTHNNQNVNFVALNSSYDSELAHQIQHEIISKDVKNDELNVSTLQNTLSNNPDAGTDVEKIVKARVSQGSFRRLLLLEKHQCNLCDISTTSVLRASHIKEWSESSREERIDANNGLLLCANHDALFDRHLISFEPSTGNICISESIDIKQRNALNISETAKISLNERMKSYMQIHYKKFIEKENQ